MSGFILRGAILLILCCSGRAASLRYWVEPCSDPASACRSGDPELAEWAMEAWQAASGGRLKLEKTSAVRNAHIRIYWVPARHGLYGEARPILVDGVQGAEVHVQPAIVPPDETDLLLRDAIVYLTCLHETGHALGMPHTSAFADIMYSFQYGGDINEYFARYRRKLRTRGDIRKNPGMSPEDRDRLMKIHR